MVNKNPTKQNSDRTVFKMDKCYATIVLMFKPSSYHIGDNYFYF